MPKACLMMDDLHMYMHTKDQLGDSGDLKSCLYIFKRKPDENA